MKFEILGLWCFVTEWSFFLLQPQWYGAVFQTYPPPSLLDRISTLLDTITQDNNKIREYGYDLCETYAAVDHAHYTPMFQNTQLSAQRKLQMHVQEFITKAVKK